ncbi:MAG TPA: hypothetical protein VN855_00525 [Candidatus Acidoferrum sp.]|nr:hypothetical protein [Candidatus Acidoferrum sp.]
MTEVLEFFKGFNIQTILSLLAIVWFFAHHIEAKIEKLSSRTDRLYEMFIDLLKEKK